MNSCRHCGEQLLTSPNGIDIYCLKPGCQRKETIERLQRESQLKEENKQAVIREGKKQLSVMSGVTNVNLGDVNVVMVPANNNGVIRLPGQRKSLFIERLTKVYHALQNDEPFNDFPYSLVEYSKAPSGVLNELLNKSCGTCQGYCCLQGADHAFLDKASLQYHVDHGRTVDLTELIEEYRHYFPEESMEHGCLFQSATGCNLPREKRALTCNVYFCKDIEPLATLGFDDYMKGAVIGAIDDGSIERISTWRLTNLSSA